MAKRNGHARSARYSPVSSQMDIRSTPRVRTEHSAEYDDLKIPPADTSAYARITSDSYLESDAVRSLHKRRKRNKVLGILAVSLLSVVLVAGGLAFAYMNNISRSLSSGLDSSLFDALMPVDAPEDPFYVLLLGVDGSDARDDDDYFAGTYRSDSMMLARIDPKGKKVAIVSIPRDTKVDLGEHGEDKINSAHAFGGPTLAVKAVSELAGVPISHYAEINLDGFASVVDALGGVEVNVPIEIDDDEAGGHLLPGVQNLSGADALILVRSRHAYDDYGSGDLYRAANQRLVLSAIAQKLLASDAITIAGTVQSLADCVVTDMGIDAIVGIAQSMRGIDSGTDIYTAVVPTTSSYEDDVWYEVVDEDAWKEMMKRVDAGLPPTAEDKIDDQTGTVIASAGTGALSGEYSVDRAATLRIRNGSGTDGVCADAQTVLESMGYKNFDLGNADNFDYEKTIVVYKDPAMEDAADQIVEAFGLGKAVEDDGDYLFDSDFLVIIGADWKI